MRYIGMKLDQVTEPKGTVKLYFIYHPHVVVILFKQIYVRQYFTPLLLKN